MRGDKRAVSVAISHTLTLAITAVLITILLVGAGDFLQTQQDSAAREKLSSIGADVASLIEKTDSLNATGEQVNISLDMNYPTRVTGETYRVRLSPESNPRQAMVYINSSTIPEPIGIKVRTDTPMEESGFRSGSNFQSLSLCSTGGHTITLGRCS